LGRGWAAMRGPCSSCLSNGSQPAGGSAEWEGQAGRPSPQKTPAPLPRTGFEGAEMKVIKRNLDIEDGLGQEGQIKPMPRLAKSRPSDRAARRKALEGRLRAAHEKAAAEAALPLIHGRCCIMGLTVLELIRTAAWWQGTIPGYSVFGMHFLTTTSDIACILCAFPLFATGTQGQCVQLGCLGPMLTLVFAMSLVDISALGAYLVVATPRPLSPGAKSYVDALEACVGVWEFALVASVALQMALCASSWRVYRELRVTGLYPPGSDPAGVGKIREISIMEVMCEAEDVELLADCEVNCDTTGLKSPLLVEAIPPSTPAPPAATAKPSTEFTVNSAKVPDGVVVPETVVEVDEALFDNSQTVKTVKCTMRPPVATPGSTGDTHAANSAASEWPPTSPLAPALPEREPSPEKTGSPQQVSQQMQAEPEKTFSSQQAAENMRQASGSSNAREEDDAAPEEKVEDSSPEVKEYEEDSKHPHVPCEHMPLPLAQPAEPGPKFQAPPARTRTEDSG